MDCALRERRTRRRIPSIRIVIGLVTALALMIVLAPAASAVPNDPNATPVPQDCEGSTGVRVFLHPGAAPVLWEVTSEDVTPDPNYLIKSVERDVFVNGEFIGHSITSLGNKTGLGETFVCTFVETFTDPDGNLVQIFGTSYKVPV
jgi:hypothetical protein